MLHAGWLRRLAVALTLLLAGCGSSSGRPRRRRRQRLRRRRRIDRDPAGGPAPGRARSRGADARRRDVPAQRPPRRGGRPQRVGLAGARPCRAEAPALVALAEEFDGPRRASSSASTPATPTCRRGRSSTGSAIPYPNIVDRDGRLQLLFADSLPPQAIPSTLVIDPQGRVAARALGKVSESSLRGIIEQLARLGARVVGLVRRQGPASGRSRRARHERRAVGRRSRSPSPPASSRSSAPACCRSRPATSPTSPGSPAPSWPTSRAAARRCSPAACCSSSASASSSSATARCSAAPGSLLLEYADVITRVLGVLVILMGLAFMG